MSHNDYIAQCKKRNPHLFMPGAKVKLTAKSLEKVITDAFNAGKQSGEQSKSLSEKIFGK